MPGPADTGLKRGTAQAKQARPVRIYLKASQDAVLFGRDLVGPQEAVDLVAIKDPDPGDPGPALLYLGLLAFVQLT